MLHGLRLPIEQTTRALQPAFGHTVFPTERGAVPGDPDRNPGGWQHLATIAIGEIRPLPRIEHDLGKIEPPGGDAEPFERLRCRLARQCPLEGELRLQPIAGLEGDVTGGEIVARESRTHSAGLYRGELPLLVRRAMGGDLYDVRLVLSQPGIDAHGVCL
jgi:hypothetical protein